MELSAGLTASCQPGVLFSWVDDLAHYEEWMGLVHRAVPLPPRDGVPRWDVELRARIGPLARSKRLIMERTVCDVDRAVVFERREVDGRRHSTWRLSVTISASEANGAPVSSLEMHLHYGGSLWTGGVVERVLHDEINRSRDRLVTLVAATTR